MLIVLNNKQMLITKKPKRKIIKEIRVFTTDYYSIFYR